MNRIQRLILLAGLLFLAFGVSADAPSGTGQSERRAFFGDLHVHTRNSLDAFMFQAIATPEDAYRYGQGDAIRHPLGQELRLRGTPLDFMAVTDHGELLGVLTAMSDLSSPVAQLPGAADIRGSDRGKRMEAFFNLQREAATNPSASRKKFSATIRSAWQDTVDAAERHNQPGVFTTFVAYEYSSAPDNQNLHRNVIFAGAEVPPIPFSSNESENPEDLWRWLESIRADGMDAIAIPHNSNVSNGLMFTDTDWAGNPFDRDYARLRMQNEPLVEVTQTKGSSETHPLLSPNDEWAEFELYDFLIASDRVSKKSGGFARQAYLLGLQYQQNAGFNPYTFGMIGASDTHNAGGSFEEDNYHGKVGVFDGSPRRRGAVPNAIENSFGSADAVETFTQWSAAGLAGIWAEKNTRNALFAAMRRKETFATSGPRIVLRFFAGFEYSPGLVDDVDMIRQAYRGGVPMGGELRNLGGKRPVFLLWAQRDRHSAPLQRLQIVKGWFEEDVAKEQVFDVACSDGLTVDETSYRCPDNGATANLETCDTDTDSGANELSVQWQDPDFDPKLAAFYYVRVLENPTCRWSSWDAMRAGAKPKPGIKATIQERAWSSPIWYRP